MTLQELVSGPAGMLRLSAAFSVLFALVYWINVRRYKNGKTSRKTVAPDPLSSDWTEIGRVTELYYYPLKSGRGKPISQCDFTDFGISYAEDGLFTLNDRMFLVYSEKTGKFQTGRSYPNLVLLNIYSVDEWSVGLEASGMPSLVFRAPETAIRRASDEVNCSMWWGEQLKCIDCGPSPAAWISKFLTGSEDSDLRLGSALPVRRNILKGPWEKFTKVYTTLRNEDTGYFCDITSYMLMNEASLGELNKRLDRTVKSLQLRPNIVVSGCEPFAEDSWEWIKIGDSVILRNVKPCPRCAMVRIDPETAEVDPLEPLKTLRSFREQKDPKRVDVDGNAPILGIYCGLYRAGPVKITDRVFALPFAGHVNT